MKGNNELRLNEATMIEAMQEYLCKRIENAPIVLSVKYLDENRDSWYVVRVDGSDQARLQAKNV